MCKSSLKKWSRMLPSYHFLALTPSVSCFAYPQRGLVQGAVVGRGDLSVIACVHRRLEPYTRHFVEEPGGLLRKSESGKEG